MSPPPPLTPPHSCWRIRAHSHSFQHRCFKMFHPLLPLPHPIRIGAVMRVHIRFSIQVSTCFTPSSCPHLTPFLLGARFVSPLVETHFITRFVAMLQHFTHTHTHTHTTYTNTELASMVIEFHSFPTFQYISNDFIPPPRRAATTPPPLKGGILY